MVTRIISAAVGVIIALLVLILHNTIVFPICVGIVAAILIFEFLQVNNLLRYKLSAVGAMMFTALLPLLSDGLRSRFRMMLAVVSVVLVLFDYVRHETQMPAKSFFAVITGMMLIGIPMASVITLNNTHEQHGLSFLILALGGAWIADTGAYFVGTFSGKHKLCPNISPNKTVEGFIGGIVANVIFFLLFNLIYSLICKANGTALTVSWVSTVIVAMACAVLGTLGDLSASVLKRQLEIKDYGKLMPGHGGLLDRFDSVLLVLPFFCAYLQATSFFNIV